jgi:cytochrome c oxidase cbb3-type subunit III
MSDFVHDGWGLFVAAAVVLSLVFCLVLLIIASRRKVMAGDNTTGHTWDVDLREMNNPLPRWWVGLFVITVVFAAVYLVLYPGLGSKSGVLNWTSSSAHAADLERWRAQMATTYAKYTAVPAAELAKDDGAMAVGERLFANYCAQCHGSDGRGSKGFPNLTDGDWLYGGSHEKIIQTITAGRQGNMPALAAAVGSAEDVRNLANYVLSLSGSPHDSVAAQLGKPKFAVCSACHGPEGKGMEAVGAPNLSDKIWLHGWGEQAIVNIITQGKVNVMPAQAGRLTTEQIYVLAAYVQSLSSSRTVASR